LLISINTLWWGLANDVVEAVTGEDFGMAENTRVLKLVDSWYIETRYGYDGPFESYEEAEVFLQLSQTAEAARRLEMAEFSAIAT